MTGNMLDRNLIFSMCDYTSRWSANFLNSTRVHNLVKTLVILTLDHSVYCHCVGLHSPVHMTRSPGRCPTPLHWSSETLSSFHPVFFTHLTVCLATPSPHLAEHSCLSDSHLEKEHQSYCQDPSYIRSPTCQKIVILCSGFLSKQCILCQFTFLDYVTIQ